MSDHNHTNTTMTEMEEITGSAVEVTKSLDDGACEINRCSTTPDVIPKMVEIDRRTIDSIESIECTVAERLAVPAEAVNSAYMPGKETVTDSSAINIENLLSRKSNEMQYNGFDDIEFADNVQMCCIEERDPNRKSYFIERHLTASSLSQTDPFEHCRSKKNSIDEDVIIQQMVDTVLFQVDRGDHMQEIVTVNCMAPQLRSNDDVVSEDESGEENGQTETRAIVHTINDVKDVEMVTAARTESIETTEKKPLISFGVYQSPSTIGQIEQFTPNSIGHSQEFKSRLSRLLGQFNDEQIKFSTPISTSRRRSISVPDNMDTLSMNGDRGSSRKMLVIGEDNIPAPPNFDQLMYDTIGRQMKMQTNQNHIPATAMGIENVFEKSFDRAATTTNSMHRSQKSVDLMKLFVQEAEAEADVISVASIRDRLNEIYGRGPLPNVTFTEENVNSDSTDSRRDSEHGIQLRKQIISHDTVYKQKQLFRDVLKSINSNVRNSLHRTDSIASADVHTDIDKHKN